MDKLDEQRRAWQTERAELLERLARCGVEARREERARLNEQIQKLHQRFELMAREHSELAAIFDSKKGAPLAVKYMGDLAEVYKYCADELANALMVKQEK
jgi:predicted nuclease with TOPRIM domain